MLCGLYMSAGSWRCSYYLIPVLASVGITDPIKQTLVTGGLSVSHEATDMDLSHPCTVH